MDLNLSNISVLESVVIAPYSITLNLLFEYSKTPYPTMAYPGSIPSIIIKIILLSIKFCYFFLIASIAK